MTTFSLWWLLYGGVRGALIVGVPLGLVPLIVGYRRGQARLGKIGFLATVAAGFAVGAAAAVLVSFGFVIAVVKRRHGENTVLPEQGPQPIKDSGSKPREIAEAQPSQWPAIRNGLLLMVASPVPVLVMFPFESGSEPWLTELATYVVAVPMFLVGVVLLVAGVISSFGRNGGLKMQFPRWLIVGAAVFLALPFGWGLGVLAAYVIAGENFGQLPLATVPLGIIASMVFALWPAISPNKRLSVMFFGSVAFIALAWLTERQSGRSTSSAQSSAVKPLATPPAASKSAPSAATAPAPQGATLLEVVNVAAPAINCVFDQSCKIVVNDTTVPITVSSITGAGLLQSRVYQAQPGSPGAGLHVYQYRIDLGNLAGTADGPLITSLSVDFGPVVGTLDYNGDGKTGDQIFVVTGGGMGSVGVTSAYQVGNIITFNFSPGIRAGKAAWEGGSSFLFGLASTKPPTAVAAHAISNVGAMLDLQTRGPDLR